MGKHETLQGSETQLLDFEMAWKTGEYPCPKCGKNLKMETLQPLENNTCPHCKEIFFMPRRLGDYYLYAPGGGGGMGSVYRSVSRRFPGKILAVKLLARKEHSNPPNIKGLLNEAAVGEHFSQSEFIAACWDHGYLDGEYFTVMPFVEGERLDKRIERLGKLPPSEVLPLILHILAAEQHIYNRGFLFRDMKPENIIINKYGYAILLDFGLCITLEEARNPQDEFISGSPYYMPPERLLGNPEDACSEIYSIGMVAYHALTGTTIYDADDLEALAQRHVAKMKVSNASKMNGIPTEISTFLERMIRREPNERQQTFQEVLEDVKKAGKALHVLP